MIYQDRNRIADCVHNLRTRYRFNLSRTVGYYKDTIDSYGYPIRIASTIDDKFLVMFQKIPSFRRSLILFTNELKPERLITEQLYLLPSFYYDKKENRVLTCELSSSIVGQSRFIEFEIDNDKMKVLAVGNHDGLSHLSSALIEDGRLIFHNKTSMTIDVADFYGTANKRIDVGNRIIWNLKTFGGPEIYFVSFSRRNWAGVNTNENTDNIYKIDLNDRLKMVYKSNCLGKPENQLFDFEISDGYFFCATQKCFEKISLKESIVYSIPMSSDLWGLPMETSYIKALNAYKYKGNVLLGLIWCKNRFYLCELEV